MMQHRIVEGKINALQLTQLIEQLSRHQPAGAYSLFIGQVRPDSHEGNLVRAIEYSCYEDMVYIKLNEVTERIKTKYKLCDAIVWHSVGEVNVQELCMVVITLATHRQEAIEACKELTECIKKEVPIWGKELFDHSNYQWKENKY
jgi:Molybdopterin converting factor, large subunit